MRNRLAVLLENIVTSPLLVVSQIISFVVVLIMSLIYVALTATAVMTVIVFLAHNNRLTIDGQTIHLNYQHAVVLLLGCIAVFHGLSRRTMFFRSSFDAKKLNVFDAHAMRSHNGYAKKERDPRLAAVLGLSNSGQNRGDQLRAAASNSRAAGRDDLGIQPND